MRIGLVHLSDLHFKIDATRNYHASHAQKISDALKIVPGEFDGSILAVTGDIAFSGQPGEYQEAGRFLSDLQTAIIKEAHLPNPRFFVAAGNHDCDFSLDNEARRLILANLHRNSDQEIDESIIETCTNVQEAYFNFLSTFPEYDAPSKNSKICETHTIGIHEKQINLVGINSAWLSQVKEDPGSLLIPVDLCGCDAEQSDLVITMFHHPYSWLEPTNARRFRASIEKFSDVILTGHEHEYGAYRKEVVSGETVQYIEGAVFQEDSDPNCSGFNFVSLDLSEERMRVYEFAWDGDMYSVMDSEPTPQPFTRNFYRLKNEFMPNSDTITFMDEPGATFTHPVKGNALRLRDIYVYPEMQETTLGKDGLTQHETIINGKGYKEYIAGGGRLCISAPEQGGKTALARTMFRELRDDGYVPVWLDGGAVTSFNKNNDDRWVKKSFTDCYSASMYEKFAQLPNESKVLIVDDFDKVALNPTGRAQLLRSFERRFSVIVLIGTETLRYYDLVTDEDEANPILEYQHLRMLEFGNRLRERLVEKWFTVGREYTENPEYLSRRVATTAVTLNTLIGRDLLPSAPIYILIAVQQVEANLPISAASGAHGYFYELLITKALSASVGYIDLDTKYSFLTFLAYHMFAEGDSWRTDSAIRQLHAEFCEDYSIRFSIDTLLDDLEKVGVLRRKDGEIGFKYRYILYYFIARHFRDNLNDEEVREHIRVQMEQLYRESCANIVIFLTYLCKDPFVIDTALERAKTLFPGSATATFADDVDFINSLVEQVPSITMVDEDHKTSRERHLRHQDEVERMSRSEKNLPTNEFDDDPSDDDPSDDEALETLLEINGAYKTVEVLGQILKNFPGSIKGSRKVEIAEECYWLGLRTLGATYELADRHLERLIDEFSNIWSKDRADSDPHVAENRAKTLVYSLCGAFGVSAIIKIASSVGSEVLQETYKTIQAKHDTNAVRLVDLAIKLDHFSKFPESEVSDLGRILRKNGFALWIFKLLVARRLYLLPMRYDKKQSVCAKLGIELAKRELLQDKRIKG